MTVKRITDFIPWDLRDEFSNYEPAYLWLGFEPDYGNEHPGNVIGLRRAMDEAVRRGELSCTTDDDSGRYVYEDRFGRERGIYVAYPTITRFSREALRKWAERKGQRPLFLFPEDRTAQLPVETANTIRREQGRQTASLQHAERNRWYANAVNRACDIWEKGSPLRHDQMANKLMENAPPIISKDTLLGKLKDALIEMGRDDLIRGFRKK